LSQENQPDPTMVYVIRLLCEQKPVLDKKQLLKELQAIDSAIKPLGDNDLCMFVNDGYASEDIAGGPGVPVLVSVAERIPQEELEVALAQTRCWPEAAPAVARCGHAVIINDMHGNHLNPNDRLENLQKVLAAVLMCVPAKAVHWPTSQQFEDPVKIAAALETGEYNSPFNGAVNVRMFAMPDGENEIVMDTLGLAYFQLPDVQCHYIDLPPNDVAQLLFNVGAYLFENGAVIDSGSTIDGCDGNEWECNWEVSLAEPEREVIDLHAGAFAAGTRG